MGSADAETSANIAAVERNWRNCMMIESLVWFLSVVWGRVSVVLCVNDPVLEAGCW
jgi:hypothetical protein